MAASSVMVSLPQMVDLALNCPEVGAVNFNILHSLLHVIIQQVDLLECKVEFKGNDSERVQNLLSKSKPGPTLNLTEYIVTPGKEQRKVISKKSKYKKIKKEDDKGSKEELVVEHELKVADQGKDPKHETTKKASPNGQIDAASSMQTVVVIEPTDDSVKAPHVSVALSRVHFDNMEDEIQKLKEEIKELKELPGNLGLIDALRNASVDKSSPVVDMFQILSLSKRIDAAETGISKLASMVEDLARGTAGRRRHSADVDGKRGSQLVGVVDIKPSQASEYSADSPDRLDKLEHQLIKLEEQVQQITGGKGKELSAPERLNELEARFAEYSEQIVTLDSMFNNQINVLQAQFTDLEKEIGEIVERINAGLPAGDPGADQNITEMYKKIMQMQEDMETMTATATKLLEDKEERQLHMDAILEQIELLKTIKANREDLEDALADKADACAVNRKVSHDQFDAAYDDLSRGIEEALVKLTQQEQLWQQALDDIQKEIGNKLDKMELTPLRDFVHNKLKMLQERLKALASLKKETEAAGTKSKYLRNVNCISCDKDVIMRKEMDPSLMPPPPALPPNKSMAPYLAYELDALRKQQKCFPHSRNMHHFEGALAGSKGKGEEDHICNRYCGGSHTVTTPQQRVTRLGHFLQQWGPEMQSLNEGQMRGTDGQMYKIRNGDIEQTPTQKRVSEDTESFYLNMKSRPSMVVQGGILNQREGMRSILSKTSEADGKSDHRESQAAAATERQSTTSQRKDSHRGSVTTAPRPSKEKRPSRGSADHSTHRASRSNRPSTHIAFREGEEAEAAAAEAAGATPEPAAAEEAAAAEPEAAAPPVSPPEGEEGGGESAPPEAQAQAETEPEPAAEAAPAGEAAAEAPPAEEGSPEE